MIFKKTVLTNYDNSGAKKLECIHITIKRQKAALLGEVILVAVKKLDYKKKIDKKKIYTSIIIGTKRATKRKNGTFIKFDVNRSLLLSDTFKFLGTRVYGLTPKEIRIKLKATKFKKIISYSKLSI
jgi:large subunit ribosomal protein L14